MSSFQAGTVVEKDGNLYRVDKETYTYTEQVVDTKTTRDFTGFDDVPICRPKFIYFKVSGLRPNTRHFVYFDDVDVSNYINTSISNVNEFKTLPRNDIKRSPGEKYINEVGFPVGLGGPSTPILTDASGTVEGVFYLQSNNIVNFPAGKRTMTFIDINVLDPASALSFATAIFTVDGGIENFKTVTTNQTRTVARTGVKDTLTFIAPVIKEAVVNNITNEYITNNTHEYITNTYVTNDYVTDEYVNNTYVTNVTETYKDKTNTENTVVTSTKKTDVNTGGSGGKTVTTPISTNVCEGTTFTISSPKDDLLPPTNQGAGKNVTATKNDTKPAEVKTPTKDNKQDTYQGGPLAGAPVSAGYGNTKSSSTSTNTNTAKSGGGATNTAASSSSGSKAGGSTKASTTGGKTANSAGGGGGTTTNGGNYGSDKSYGRG